MLLVVSRRVCRFAPACTTPSHRRGARLRRRGAAPGVPMISTFLVESGIVGEESGMESRSDTSALRRHVPLPGYN